MATTLIVIEAPGKIPVLKQLLRQAGLTDVSVLATRGHLAHNPTPLKEVGVDHHYAEPAYSLKPGRYEMAERIRREAQAASRVILATDDDHEGDVIARDVHRFCLGEADRAKALRCRLKALTQDELAQSLRDMRPMTDNIAAKGDARRIVDRLIGALSTQEAVIGRVLGSTLLELRESSLITGFVIHTMPARDGGPSWLATESILGDQVIHPKVFDEAAPPGHSNIQAVRKQPLNHNEILFQASVRTGYGIKDVADAMQDLYERGRISYPRSRSNTISMDGLKRVEAIAKRSGVRFDRAHFQSVRGRDETGHEVPHPTVLDVPLGKPTALATKAEAVHAVMTQALLECGMPCLYERPRLDHLPAGHPALGLSWVRLTPLSECAWRKTDETAKVVRFTPEQRLLKFMHEHELGRPSTMVAHVEAILKRGLLDPSGALTERGKRWAFATDQYFFGKNLSRAVELYIDGNTGSSPELVDGIISSLRLDAVRSLLMESLSEDHHNEYETEEATEDAIEEVSAGFDH